MLNKQLAKNFETFIQHFVNVIFIILLQLCSDVSQIFYILDIESMIEKFFVISRCKTFTQNVVKHILQKTIGYHFINIRFDIYFQLFPDFLGLF